MVSPGHSTALLILYIPRSILVIKPFFISAFKTAPELCCACPRAFRKSTTCSVVTSENSRITSCSDSAILLILFRDPVVPCSPIPRAVSISASLFKRLVRSSRSAVLASSNFARLISVMQLSILEIRLPVKEINQGMIYFPITAPCSCIGSRGSIFH